MRDPATSPKDPNHLHAIALKPLWVGAGQQDLLDAVSAIHNLDEDTFLNFLIDQGLAPMWDQVLETYPDVDGVSDHFKSALHQSRLLSAGTYLLHKHALGDIRRILDDADVAHVIMKGAHIRERFYADPDTRGACDVDVLVDEGQKESAIRAFMQSGFELYAPASNISHEASLVKGSLNIDLHWHVLRPGRLKVPLTKQFLDNRQDYDSYWGMDDTATLFLALIHPVFTKYATTPQAALMRLVDLDVMLNSDKIQTDQLLDLLSRSGLKTAAWISLRWLSYLKGVGAASALEEEIRPGKLRERYLMHWLSRNLATRFVANPSLTQIGFTLEIGRAHV